MIQWTHASLSPPTDSISIGSSVFCGAEGRDQRTEGHRQTDRQTDTRATHALKQPVRETDHATSGHLVIVIVYHCTFYF